MIGALSKRYESNGKPGAIGFDAVGGWSYGLYQIASRTGAMSLFLVWLANNKSYRFAYDRLQRAGGDVAARDGRDTFKAAWGVLADDAEFSQAQHEYIKHSHYDVQAARIRAAGIDPDARSAALRDVIWSTAVQHGAKTNVITGVIAEHGAVSDAALITLIYAERRTRFGSSTDAVRKAVMRRFDMEQAEALRMLNESKASHEPQKPEPKPARSAETVSRSTIPTVEPVKSTNNRSNYL